MLDDGQLRRFRELQARDVAWTGRFLLPYYGRSLLFEGCAHL